MNETARTFDKRFFLAYILCSLAAVFCVPLFVPMPPSVSPSYIFGYNNRVGVMLLLILVAIGAIWTKGLGFQFATKGDAKPISVKVLIWSLIGVFVGCAVIYALAGRFTGFGESSYEIDRTWLTSQGKVPYVDFEWPFGVALLYGPLLFRHLVPIDLVQAYYLFWAINWLVGTLLLYMVVNMIDYPSTSKTRIFLLIYAAGVCSILCTGTHYSFLRFTCPLFFILIVQRLINAATPRANIYAAALAVLFTATLLLISPETAIAHAFACVCIFLLPTPTRSAGFTATLLGFLLSLATVFCVASKLHVLDTLKASSGGADSFPIIPAPHILLFFAAAFICACYVFRRFADKRICDNTIGLIAFSIAMMAAALGRCDPLHVFWDGEGIFLASMFYVAHYKTLWKWYQAVFVIVMVIVADLSFAQGYVPFIKTAVVDTMADNSDPSIIRRSVTHMGQKYIVASASPSTNAKWQQMLKQAELATPSRLNLANLYPTWHGTFLAPFGYRPDGIGTYQSDQIDYGHFEGFENANTIDATHAKLRELVDRPGMALLLPSNFQDGCIVNIRARQKAISSLFSFPYFGKAVHPDSIRQPICSYIVAHYIANDEPSPKNFGYGLWIPKPVEVAH